MVEDIVFNNNMGKFGKKDFKEDPPKSGRIGRLDESTLGYYRRVSETIENGFENDDEKGLFLNNVLTQLAEEVLKVSQNQTVSGIVEKLIQLANPTQLQLIVEALSKDWETACCDRFASHVTQKVVLFAGKVLTRSEDKEDSENRKLLQQHVENVWNFLHGSIGLYMQHMYASHVIRTLIEVVGIMHVSDSVVKSRVSQQYKKDQFTEKEVLNSLCEPSKENLEMLTNLTNKILSFHKLNDYLINSLSNPVIQTLILVLKKRLPDLCDELCKGIMPHCFKITDEENKVEGLVTDHIGSHLVEQLICASSTEIFTELFNEHIKGNLCDLALHNIANFVIQKIIINCRTQKQFETVYKELHSILEDLLAHNHLGIVVKLAEGALIHGTKQEKLVKSLMKAFHCYKPEERQSKLVPLIASLTTYDIFYKLPDEKETNKDDSSDSDSDDEIVVPTLKKINYHGSVVLQKLFSFGNPRLIVNSFLELKAAEISTMTCDPCGSHVIDVFLKSETVGDKSREQLVNKLKGYFNILACDKHGSRTLDTMWTCVNIKQKITIAEDLVKQKDKLRGNRFGFYVWKNCALEKFIQRRKEWMEFQTGEQRKRKLFKDIIGSTNETKKQKMSTDSNETVERSNSNLTSEGEDVGAADNKTQEKSKKKKRKSDEKDHDKTLQSSTDTDPTTKKKQMQRVVIKDKKMKKLLNDIQPKTKKSKNKRK